MTSEEAKKIGESRKSIDSMEKLAEIMENRSVEELTKLLQDLTLKKIEREIPQKVAVINQPEVQKVEGETISQIKNWPDVFKVAGEVFAKVVFPAIQKVSGDVTATIGNFPVIQKIVGNVNAKVDNFPEVQKVQITNPVDKMYVEGRTEITNLPIGKANKEGDPERFLTIRLTDGKKYYDLNEQQIVGAGMASAHVNRTFVNSRGESRPALVDDNGRIEVAAELELGGTVGTELPDAVALADNMANPTAPSVGAHNLGWDNSNSQWQRIRTSSSTNAMDVGPIAGNRAYADGESNTASTYQSFDNSDTLMRVRGEVFNGTTWDRRRGDTNGAYAHGNVASGASDAGNPVKVGGRYNSTRPTLTDGQRGDLQVGTRGSLNVTWMREDNTTAFIGLADSADGVATSATVNKVATVGRNTVYNGSTWDLQRGNAYGTVVQGTLRANKDSQATTITSSTSETTIVTAVASTFCDLYGLILTNSSTTGTLVTIKDSTAGTTRFTYYLPPLDSRGFMLPAGDGHKQASVNNNWTATCGTSVASIFVTALFAKNT